MTVAEVNARFAIVGVGNKMVVMETDADGTVVELWPFEEFKKKLVKEKIKYKSKDESGEEVVKTKPLADYWLQSREGRQFERLVYDMPGSTTKARPNDYNGWQGFAVEPKKGDWSLNRKHVLEMICGGNEEWLDWTLNWMAALFQFPGRHAMTSIVLRGRQGTGKGHFAHNLLGLCFGPQQYLHILGANQLTAEFNEHLSGKSYVFADESTWGGDPKAAAKLKGLVTEDTVPIHRKFLKMVEEPSALHTVISSNNEWPIPIEHDDRRFTVYDVLDAHRQDDGYFAALRAELANGGRAAMLADMLAYPIRDRDLRKPLVTGAKTHVTTQSLKPIEHWWYEALQRGVIKDDDWPTEIRKAELHASYLDFLDRVHKNGRERRSTETEMGMFLRKFSPLSATRFTVSRRQERFMLLPSLKECREAWIRMFHWAENHEWDTEAVELAEAPRNAGDIPF